MVVVVVVVVCWWRCGVVMEVWWWWFDGCALCFVITNKPSCTVQRSPGASQLETLQGINERWRRSHKPKTANIKVC